MHCGCHSFLIFLTISYILLHCGVTTGVGVGVGVGLGVDDDDASRQNKYNKIITNKSLINMFTIIVLIALT